jgi:cellulase
MPTLQSKLSSSTVSELSVARMRSTYFATGVDQGDGRNAYIRSPPNNSPVKDLTSSAVACNVNNVAVPKTLEISAGDVITFEWAHDNRGDDIIAESHKGPVQVYVAPTSSNGEGAVWVKIFSEAYTSQWVRFQSVMIQCTLS